MAMQAIRSTAAESVALGAGVAVGVVTYGSIAIVTVKLSSRLSIKLWEASLPAYRQSGLHINTWKAGFRLITVLAETPVILSALSIAVTAAAATTISVRNRLR